jgi:hypothetical protein
MDPRAEAAARNNAGWCDLVCRSHGIPTVTSRQVWRAFRRSPPLYPDAVTLRAGVTEPEVLDGVDRSPGCSVKDSDATLDLAPAGFRVLFEAEWIHRPPTPTSPDAGALAWVAVRTPDELRSWAALHGAGSVLRPQLLDHPEVVVLAGVTDDGLVAGGIGVRHAGVVGLCNVFTVSADPDLVWAGLADAVSDRFPDLPLVGYEHGPDLTSARNAGFTSAGPLRVWLTTAGTGRVPHPSR